MPCAIGIILPGVGILRKQHRSVTVFTEGCIALEQLMRYHFDWDIAKALTNYRKHGVRFREGATIFIDPRALTIVDSDHGNGEERWVTIGISDQGRVLVVCHTFREETSISATIRIYSCRKANNREIDQYTE